MESRIVALEETSRRHEAIIELLRTDLAAIRVGVAEIGQRMSDSGKPGETRFCTQHMNAITELRREVHAIKAELDQVKSWIWRGLGALAVVVFVLNLFGPSIREMLHTRTATTIPMVGTP